jgi:hypothetical protein
MKAFTYEILPARVIFGEGKVRAVARELGHLKKIGPLSSPHLSNPSLPTTWRSYWGMPAWAFTIGL